MTPSCQLFRCKEITGTGERTRADSQLCRGALVCEHYRLHKSDVRFIISLARHTCVCVSLRGVILVRWEEWLSASQRQTYINVGLAEKRVPRNDLF